MPLPSATVRLAIAAALLPSGAVAQFPWSLPAETAFGSPARPFVVDCTTPPAADVVFHWDVNCGMNATDKTWTSRVGGLVANWNDATVSMDSTRGLARMVLSTGKHVVLPYDMRPSRHPAFTMEILVSIGSVTASSLYRALWSTEEPGTTVAASRGRGGLVYDGPGAGIVHAPWCASSMSSSSLPIGSG